MINFAALAVYVASHVRELNDPSEAAIASQEAGAHFGLSVLQRDIPRPNGVSADKVDEVELIGRREAA